MDCESPSLRSRILVFQSFLASPHGPVNASVSWTVYGADVVCPGQELSMPTVDDMRTSLEDARFFHEQIDRIVRGPQQQHDTDLIRRYFRAYLHCWKTVLHFVRTEKGLDGGKNNAAWISWCQRWLGRFDPNEIQIFEQLRETRDHDTHKGKIEVGGEVAAGLFPIVMLAPANPSHSRRELISCTRTGLALGDRLINDYPTTS